MLNQMQKYRIGAVTLKYMPMVMFSLVFGVEYMTKQFFTKFLQKIILCFKMRVKSSPAYICRLDNFTYSNLIKFFLESNSVNALKMASRVFL